MQAANDLEHHIDGCTSSFTIRLNLLPGGLFVQVAIGSAGYGHGCVQAVFEMALCDVMAHNAKASLYLCYYRMIGLAQGLWLGNYTAKFALKEAQCTVYGIAVCCYEFVIVATNELFVGEVAVTSLWGGGGQVVA